MKVKYFTDGYYDELPSRVDSVDEINKDLKICTGVMNAIGKELPTIIPFEGKEALTQKISQLRKGQEITIKYFTDGYYEDIAGVLDAVDTINKELRIYTDFINDTGKELPTIIAFEDILENGVNALSFGNVNAYCVHDFSSIILYLQPVSIFYSLPIRSIW